MPAFMPAPRVSSVNHRLPHERQLDEIQKFIDKATALLSQSILNISDISVVINGLETRRETLADIASHIRLNSGERNKIAEFNQKLDILMGYACRLEGQIVKLKLPRELKYDEVKSTSIASVARNNLMPKLNRDLIRHILAVYLMAHERANLAVTARFMHSVINTMPLKDPFVILSAKKGLVCNFFEVKSRPETLQKLNQAIPTMLKEYEPSNEEKLPIHLAKLR